jgi:hypothetical protein
MHYNCPSGRHAASFLIDGVWPAWISATGGVRDHRRPSPADRGGVAETPRGTARKLIPGLFR